MEHSRQHRLRTFPSFSLSSLTLACSPDLELTLSEPFALSQTAGDLAYSMNHNEAYSFLLDEGIRAEMLKAALQAAASPSSEEEEEDNEVDPMDSSKEVIKLSTASDNNTFLSSKLRFVTDEQGQEIAIDEEGNGVMMGWEREIMRKTAERCCEGFEGRRRGEGLKDEDGDEVEFKFVNVGFGLGIVSSLRTLPLSCSSLATTLTHQTLSHGTQTKSD